MYNSYFHPYHCRLNKTGQLPSFNVQPNPGEGGMRRGLWAPSGSGQGAVCTYGASMHTVPQATAQGGGKKGTWILVLKGLTKQRRRHLVGLFVYLIGSQLRLVLSPRGHFDCHNDWRVYYYWHLVNGVEILLHNKFLQYPCPQCSQYRC